MDNKEQWVFFLKLSKDLPKEFFTLDQQFKASSKSLVPVGLSSLSSMVSSGRRIHVMVIVRNVSEYNYFKLRVVKILKYLMRSDKIYLYVASSFSSINENQIMRKDHYNFIKIPVATSFLCGSISNMIDMRDTGGYKWPGGLRSNFQLAG